MAVIVSILLGAPERARSLSFDVPRVIIGRGAGCDVRLPDPSVSQQHATIRREKDHYVVVDEASTNGTYVNGERLPSRGRRRLKRETRIRTGRIQIDVLVEQASTPSAAVDETRALALEIVANAGWLTTNSPPTVTIAEGPDAGKTLTLEKSQHTYRLGRSPECDLELGDPDASRHHLELRRDDAGVWVRDCDSKNGTALNGRPVPSGRALLWEAKLSIRVGETLFDLSDAADEKLSELTDAPDESISAVPDDLTFAPAFERASGVGGSEASALAASTSGGPATATNAKPDSTGTSSIESKGEAAAASSAVAEDPPVVPRTNTRRVPWLDLSIVVLALLVLAASAIGIYWLFSGS